jgi:hypothetical protein
MPRDNTAQKPAGVIRPYSRQPRNASSQLKTPSKLELGSDFTPSPSPSTDDSRSSAFCPKDEPIDHEDDIKPDMSEDDDTKPAKKVRPKKTPSPAKNKTGARVGAWTGGEDWALFKMIHPKITPNWAAIAEAVGRDSKVS